MVSVGEIDKTWYTQDWPEPTGHVPRFEKDEILDRVNASHIETLVRRKGGDFHAKLGRPNHSGHALIQCCFHEDRKPSLSINVRNGGYRCFSCGEHGDFFHLVSHATGASTFREQINEAAEIVGLSGLNSGPYRIPVERPVRMLSKPEYNLGDFESFPYLPDDDSKRVVDMVALIDSAARDYLHGSKRSLTDSTVAKWEIGWHPGARRIAIPQRDVLGRLVNIGGRYLGDAGHLPPWMHAFAFRKSLFIFGEHQFGRDRTKGGTMVLVEGMFDAIYLDQMGIPNVGAMLGSYVSKCQADKMDKWFERVVIIPDGDGPGRNAAAQAVKSLAGRVKTEIYPTPDGLDPDELRDEHIDAIRRMVG